MLNRKTYNRDLVESILDGIMDSFDFERVHKCMELLDWKWCVQINENGGFNMFKSNVPSVYELKQTAANLLWYTVNCKEDLVATGGFQVEKDFSDPDKPWISLKFIVEECEN